MWNDADIDMEELEARLYGQVYHSMDRDKGPDDSYQGKGSPCTNTASRVSGRYFDNHQLYQTAAINEALQNITNLAMNNFGCATDNLLPEFIPTVNNVLILPPPSMVQQQYSSQHERRRDKAREKRRKRRVRDKKALKEMKRMLFKEHHIDSTKVASAGAGNGCAAEVVISVSESGGSDCEITEPNIPTVEVISESEDEENITTSMVKDLDGNGDNQATVFTSEEDEVTFVESEQNEMIIISCDETSMQGDDVTNAKGESITENVDSTSHLLVNVPESTNDFLDSNVSRNVEISDNFNASATNASADMWESASNHSASDFDEPVKPAQDENQSFSELNLDSFTSFIASKGNELSSGLNLTPIRTAASKESNAMQFSRSKRQVELRNSSDSSSESDYEEGSKVGLMKGNTQMPTKRVRRSSSTSESDYCVVDKKNTAESSDESKINENEGSSMDKERIVVMQSDGDSEIEMEKEVQFFPSTDDESPEVEIVKEQQGKSSNDFELANISKQSTDGASVGLKKFSDYWTDDLNKFYFESWGQEEFNLEKELKAMSDDPSKWKILARDRVNIKLISKRPRCHRCHESGHKVINCPKALTPLKCSLCGQRGHQESRCPNKLCTSCGRKSHYFTTYCSRCAISRQTCRICSARGHTAARCTDLWRRYHLTTKPGPLKQPSCFDLKPAEERWCSGCTLQGHFEHDCNYYNRSHAPSDPTIHSYTDVYVTHQEQQASSNVSQQSSCPQYTTLQATPHGFSLQQNITNVFYSSPNQFSKCMSDALAKSHTSQEANNAFPLPLYFFSEEYKRKKISLSDEEAHQLLSNEGAHFLKELTKERDVKVNIKTNNKGKKVCIVRGPKSLLAEMRQKIRSYCQGLPKPPKLPKPPQVSELIDGNLNNEFVRQKLTQLVSNNNWLNKANTLYRKITKAEKLLEKMKVKRERSFVGQEKHVRSLFKELNSLLIVKLYLGYGANHLKVLNSGACTDAELKESYNYVFNNGERLDIDYRKTISDLINCKQSTGFLLKKGTAICLTNKMKAQLRQLKFAHERMVKANYCEAEVSNFKASYNSINEANKRLKNYFKTQHAPKQAKNLFQ